MYYFHDHGSYDGRPTFQELQSIAKRLGASPITADAFPAPEGTRGLALVHVMSNDVAAWVRCAQRVSRLLVVFVSSDPAILASYMSPTSLSPNVTRIRRHLVST